MVLKRLRDMTVATINEGLDKIENPVVMLNQYMRDLEVEIVKAEQAITKQIVMKNRFEQMLTETKQMINKRKHQAEIALDSGEEELARKALSQKLHYEEKVKQYNEHFEDVCKQVTELNEQLHEMKEKFYEMRDRKYQLMARANSVMAKQQMNATMNRFDYESTAKGFARIEERILEMEVSSTIQRKSRYEPNEMPGADFDNHDAIDQELEAIRSAKQNAN
ncbi:PspA/IM30 family protein [Anaerobacillus sp. MEB173]|uniref:PspA/IM30 family protein n=1 Tax=Anaerobacillus sp. MEB173 TaxID=3383345 RepID=UPI003F92AA92